MRRLAPVTVRPVEALMLGYLGLMATIVALFMDRLDGGPALLAGYAGAVLFLLGAVRAEERWAGSRVAGFVRFAAPLLVLPFAYAAVGRTYLVLHGRHVDDTVRAWETALFGTSPNAALSTAGAPWLTEVLTFCYFCFYVCFLIPVILYARARRELAERYLFASLTAMLACYAGFLVVPLAGPAATAPALFAAHRPSGYLVTDMQNALMAALDPPGTYFPSSHVAGVWIALLCLRRHVCAISRAGLWVLAAGVSVAVVYDWYHYASDVAAGLAVAVAAHAVTRRLGARPAPRRIPVRA